MEIEKRKKVYQLFREYYKEISPPIQEPQPFEEWWEGFKKRESLEKKKRPSKEGKKLVGEYSDVVKHDIAMCIDTFKTELTNKGEKSREPSLREFTDYFPKYLKGETWSWDRGCYVNLMIKYPGHVAGKGVSKALNKQITSVLKYVVDERKKDPMVNFVNRRETSPNIMRVGNCYIEYNRSHIRLNELARYLVSFRLHNKYKDELTIENMLKKARLDVRDLQEDLQSDEWGCRAFKERYENRDSKDNNVQRSFFKDIEIAETVLKHIKMGRFPITEFGKSPT